ncbi:MAG TPA: PD-(D/E)XK nuclease family protein [Bdellovibrionota bacterium]|nr:PD-(D/E)XK nuclease family protein [Bdellovibrionota bacterium]
MFDHSEFSGLTPRAWLCVGDGYAREDVKAALLGAGATLTSDAVTAPASLALRLLAALGDPSEPVLERAAKGVRQEALRAYLTRPEASAIFPEIRRLMRRRGFLIQLDRAVSGGRLVFSHPEEGSVLAAKVAQVYGESPLRGELFALRGAFELLLEARGLADDAMLFERAAAALATKGWPESVRKPARVVLLYARGLEALERHFFEELSRHLTISEEGSVRSLGRGPVEPARPEPDIGWKWHRWHTLDDAADALAEACDPVHDRVLIPDDPPLRRSLMRALQARGLTAADPRDPTRVRSDEGVKRALLPLRVVARGYARTDVLAWLRATAPTPGLWSQWSREIQSRGIRRGREAYVGGALDGKVEAELAKLHERFGGRLDWSETADRHVALLRRSLPDPRGGSLPPIEAIWTRYFEGLWQSLGRDLDRLGRGRAKCPALYWLERLQERLEQSPPPVEPLRPVSGLGVFRLQQAPPPDGQEVGRLWILGLPPRWFQGEARGDLWWSGRDREALSGEFGVRGSRAVRAERLAVASDWLSRCREAIVLDAAYGWDGQERESLAADLLELPGTAAFFGAKEPEDKGAHARWLPGYGSPRPVQPQRVQMAADAEWSARVIDATELERFSKCGFLGLSEGRWKLDQLDEPDSDLWPTARGTLLHKAVELLVGSWRGGGEGTFGLGAREALDQAWSLTRPRGLLSGERVERHVRDRLVRVLERFMEQERVYRSRSGAVPLALEEKKSLVLDLGPAGQIKGRPDRIDEHPDGLFVMDYKTSSSQPSGSDMLEQGYRLQLPFYALAARGAYTRPVAGVQFVELTRTGGRTRGIFLKRLNGKGPGTLTDTRAKKSLFDVADPDELWSRARDQVEAHVARYRALDFEAKPKKGDADCRLCRSSDLCGRRRVVGEGAESEGEAASEES